MQKNREVEMQNIVFRAKIHWRTEQIYNIQIFLLCSETKQANMLCGTHLQSVSLTCRHLVSLWGPTSPSTSRPSRPKAWSCTQAAAESSLCWLSIWPTARSRWRWATTEPFITSWGATMGSGTGWVHLSAQTSRGKNDTWWWTARLQKLKTSLLLFKKINKIK